MSSKVNKIFKSDQQISQTNYSANHIVTWRNVIKIICCPATNRTKQKLAIATNFNKAILWSHGFYLLPEYSVRYGPLYPAPATCSLHLRLPTLVQETNTIFCWRQTAFCVGRRTPVCVSDKNLSVCETNTFLCGRRTPFCVGYERLSV